jgi:hypothetical protein
MPDARGQKNPAMNRQLTENLDGLGGFSGHAPHELEALRKFAAKIGRSR